MNLANVSESDLDAWLNKLIKSQPFLAKYKDKIREYALAVIRRANQGKIETTGGTTTESPKTYFIDSNGFPCYKQGGKDYFDVEKIAQSDELYNKFISMYPDSRPQLAQYKAYYIASEKLKKFIDPSTNNIDILSAVKALDTQTLLDAGIPQDVIDKALEYIRQEKTLSEARANQQPRGYPPGITSEDVSALQSQINATQAQVNAFQAKLTSLQNEYKRMYEEKIKPCWQRIMSRLVLLIILNFRQV